MPAGVSGDYYWKS